MNKTTFDKIRENSATLHKIYGNGKYENYELFDEPFKLAIEVLYLLLYKKSCSQASVFTFSSSGSAATASENNTSFPG